MNESVVIIGAGQAGAQCALCLRQNGFGGDITLIGDESHLPYERPPLSKDFLAGRVPRGRMTMRPEALYADMKITLRLETSVAALDRAASRIRLASGETVPYSHLVFATGGRVRRLTCPGADLAGIFYLRTIDDVESFRERMTAGARVAIVGGGYIGLEVAAVAIGLGCAVTVVETLPRVLARVTAPEMSRFYEETHRAHGVDLRTETAVTGFAGDGRVQQVVFDGGAIDVDLVIVGIGIVANSELAAAAGLAVDNGIVVDEFTRTADPKIYAIGDCSNHPSPLYDLRHRIESVPNALGQGKTAALAILGQAAPYDEVPWFWSDQYDLKLQMTGIFQPGDTVVIRGQMAEGRFSLCYLRNGVFVACQAVNMARDFIQSKKLIAVRARPDPLQLADPAIALKDIALESAVS